MTEKLSTGDAARIYKELLQDPKLREAAKVLHKRLTEPFNKAIEGATRDE